MLTRARDGDRLVKLCFSTAEPVQCEVLGEGRSGPGIGMNKREKFRDLEDILTP